MSERKKHLPLLLGSGAALLTLSATIYGAKSGLEDLSKSLIQGNGDKGVHRTERLDELALQLGFGSIADVERIDLERSLIGRYANARNNLIGYFEYQLQQTPNDEKLIEDLERQRKAIVTDGGILLKELFQSQSMSIDQNEKISIDGVAFDLHDTFQLFLADQLIQLKIQVNNPDSNPHEITKAQREIEDLKWLREENSPIVFESDVFVLPSEKRLIYLATTVKIIQELDYPLPTQITYRRYQDGDPGAGWYDALTNTVYITEKSTDDTNIHEMAHHQADENQKFSQATFNQLVHSAIESIGDPSTLDLNRTFINRGVFDPTNMEKSLIEDYAETLRTYFVDGVAFRQRIKDYELRGYPETQVLRAKYEFAKKFFKGKEYLHDGIVFEPQAGDVFAIDDPDYLRRGIGLRVFPTVERIFVSPPVGVYDQNKVLLLDGPVEVSDPVSGTSKKMWLVQLVNFEALQPDEKFKETTQKGWILEDWFGDKVAEEIQLGQEATNQKFEIESLVEIVDEDENPGILLRPLPVGSIDYKDQDWPAVFDGDWVEIIEGPETIIRYIYSYETGDYVEILENWWKVKIYSQASFGTSMIGFINGEGWISEIWFGEKVPTID